MLQRIFARGYLSGLSEMYWVGLAQRLFKSNARNLPDQEASRNEELRRELSAVRETIFSDS